MSQVVSVQDTWTLAHPDLTLERYEAAETAVFHGSRHSSLIESCSTGPLTHYVKSCAFV